MINQATVMINRIFIKLVVQLDSCAFGAASSCSSTLSIGGLCCRVLSSASFVNAILFFMFSTYNDFVVLLKFNFAFCALFGSQFHCAEKTVSIAVNMYKLLKTIKVKVVSVKFS